MRDYFDNRWHSDLPRPDEFVDAPTAFAVFANQFVPEGEPPREWAERLYNLQRWTRMHAAGTSRASKNQTWWPETSQHSSPTDDQPEAASADRPSWVGRGFSCALLDFGPFGRLRRLDTWSGSPPIVRHFTALSQGVL